ncbi:MAG: SOS response-associated peptidase [bacterium]|jgi:putative SOS response-associated peptidase YedK|nr:SOS response-associated peptidase [bacterium]
MCGRYAFSRVDKQLLERLALDADELPEGLAPHWNIAPGQAAAALRQHGRGRRLDLLRWGLPRPGARAGALLINARAETAATLPAFREAFRARRCGLPCEGWYEWRRPNPKTREPWFIRPAAGETALLAGLWAPLPGGGAAFAILTCPAAPAIAHLHGRMPVVLPAELWPSWLAGEGDAADWAPRLAPWPDPELECWPVSPEVNGRATDHEGLTRPVAAAQGSLF